MATDEFSLINRYFKTPFAYDRNPSVVLGIGDDAAILELTEKHQLVVAVDTLVSGVHFPVEASPTDIAQRALRVNLSDLAAMAATPLWFTLALTLPKDWSPEYRESWVNDFASGLKACADQYTCHLVGGDTTSGPLSITIQVMGQVPCGQALRRDGAKVGDLVLVTHCLGDGAAALAYLQNELPLDDEHAEYLRQRFYQPEPRIAEAQLLQSITSAAQDVSDGLIADIGHICTASDVACEINIESIPLSDALKSCDLNVARQWALSGGDDYELVFTIAPENMQKMHDLQARGEVDATVIGRIITGAGVVCRLNESIYTPEFKGFEHFK